MTKRAPLGRALLGAALLLALGACRSAGEAGAARARAPGTPPRFARLDTTLTRGVERSAAGDAAGVRALRGPVVEEGLALLRARLPHDLARADVPRFLAARAYFGEALKRYVEALDGPDDAAAFAATRALYEAHRGWIAAYQGLAPETAV